MARIATRHREAVSQTDIFYSIPSCLLFVTACPRHIAGMTASRAAEPRICPECLRQAWDPKYTSGQMINLPPRLALVVTIAFLAGCSTPPEGTTAAAPAGTPASLPPPP